MVNSYASELQTVVNEPIYDGISFNMINNDLKRLLLLAHADTRFTSAIKMIEQSEIVPLYIG